MLTEYDVQALIELLQRTPMTKPEQLFAGRLVETLMAMVEKPADSQHTATERSEDATPIERSEDEKSEQEPNP
jgi:hypothetical protein